MHHNLIIKDGDTTKVVKEVLVDGIQFVDEKPRAGSTNLVTSNGVATAVGGASDVLQDQIDDIAEKAGSGYIPKGEATVATLNALSGQENGELYTMTDAGTLTDGSLAVVAGDTVAWDATNSVWYKAMDYAPAQYGTNEVHNLQTSITAFRTGDYIAVDGPSGTAKMSKDDLLKETAENALAGNVAPAFDPTKPNGYDGYAYHVGEVVTNNGKLYRFKANKATGAWDSSKVTAITEQKLFEEVSEDVGMLESDKADKIKTYSELTYTVNSGAFVNTKTYSGASYSQGTARNIVMTSGFTPGDKIYVTGTNLSNSNYGLIGFFDSSHNSLYYYFEADKNIDGKPFVIPTGTAEIRVNGYTGKLPSIKVVSSETNLSDVKNEVDGISGDVAILKTDKADKINTYSKLTYTVNSGYYVNVKTYDGATYSQASARNIVMTGGFSEGETIYVTGLSEVNSNYGLIGFFDGNHNSLSYYYERDVSFDRKRFTIPAGTAEIRVNGYTGKIPAIEIVSNQKNLSDVYDEVRLNRFLNSNAFSRIEELQKGIPFSITIDHPILSFVFDDTLSDVKEIADIFLSKGLPCCFATIPSKLGDYILNSTTVTRGEALLSAQSNGCEILVHGSTAMSSTSTDEQVYNLFVGNKMKLEDYGFNTQGIIEVGSGGGENTFDYKRCEKFLKDLYRYSDYYGTGLNLPQYYTNNRTWMSSDLATNKSRVDSIVSGNSWRLMSAHAVVDGIGLQTLSDTIDYAVSAGCEIITMREVYDAYSNR